MHLNQLELDPPTRRWFRPSCHPWALDQSEMANNALLLSWGVAIALVLQLPKSMLILRLVEAAINVLSCGLTKSF